jgi:hypothetical protein
VLEAAGERPVAAYAIHVNSAGLPPGVFRTRRGAIMSGVDDLGLAEPARRRLATAT